MRFTTHQVRGRGRGKFLGFPTINMEIPRDMQLQEGIWAVWVDIGGNTYKGALHFGPIPTFADPKKSLEVFLLDISSPETDILDTSRITVRAVQRLREVRAFNSQEELVEQMKADIALVQAVLAPV